MPTRNTPENKYRTKRDCLSVRRIREYNIQKRKRNSDKETVHPGQCLPSERSKNGSRKGGTPPAVYNSGTGFRRKHLEMDLSPEQVVGVARKENIPIVSHERIYQHVWLDKKRNSKLHEHLRNQGRR